MHRSSIIYNQIWSKSCKTNMSVDFNLKEKQWIHFFLIGGNVVMDRICTGILVRSNLMP